LTGNSEKDGQFLEKRNRRAIRLNCHFRLPNWVDFEKITEQRENRRTTPIARNRNVAERSKYQDKIIKNYYANREAIGLQRLGELAGELYLAEGKARAKAWKNIRLALEKLKIPEKRIEHLVKQDDPALVAKLVEELLAQK